MVKNESYQRSKENPTFMASGGALIWRKEGG